MPRVGDKFGPVFNDLVEQGESYPFYGVDGNVFKIGDMALEVVEDENDGYRSAMDEVRPVKVSEHIFFKNPVDVVRLVVAKTEEDHMGWNEFNGWSLVSVKDGHVWLTFGTDSGDGYYPRFIFLYHPRTVGAGGGLTGFLIRGSRR